MTVKQTLTKKQEKFRQKYGPWAVVTGASDGIGREMAVCLAKAGLNLVLVARRETVLNELASNLAHFYAIQTKVLALDLSEVAAVDNLIATTADLEVGLVVACAGFGITGRLIDSNLEQELNMLAVNCRAVLTMSLLFGKRFAEQGRGGIVLMSSLLAFQGAPFSANYAATKAYVQTLAEGLHVELAPLGVDVIASAPGPVKSGFAARADMVMGFAANPTSVALATLDALGKRTTVRPGFLSKALEASLALLPRQWRVRAMGNIMYGMTNPKKLDKKLFISR